MRGLSIYIEPEPLLLDLGNVVPRTDDELFELCARNPELRIERDAKGDLTVMTPAGWASSRRSAEVVRALSDWARADGYGVVTDSSGGYILPDTSMRAPDASWVLRSRLSDISPEAREKFLPLCPDFVVEIKSPSDRLAALQAKMEEYRDNDARLGWLIDPQARQVHVYRPGREPEALEDPAEVSGDPELPGFVLELAPIWEPL
jgi:Uma2 family endonuclease